MYIIFMHISLKIITWKQLRSKLFVGLIRIYYPYNARVCGCGCVRKRARVINQYIDFLLFVFWIISSWQTQTFVKVFLYSILLTTIMLKNLFSSLILSSLFNIRSFMSVMSVFHCICAYNFFFHWSAIRLNIFTFNVPIERCAEKRIVYRCIDGRIYCTYKDHQNCDNSYARRTWSRSRIWSHNSGKWVRRRINRQRLRPWLR